MFEGKKTTPKQKRIRLLLAVVIVLSMFAVRLVLIRTGVIGDAGDLTDEELQSGLASHEVTLETAAGTGRGTILLVSAQRGDNPDVVYIITTADYLTDEAGADLEITVTLPTGTEVTGEKESADAEKNLAVVSLEMNGLTACYFSEDDLYQKQAGSQVYWLSDGAALQKGTFEAADAEEDGYASRVLTAEGSMDGTTEGAGLYDTTGYYLGMLLTEKDGTLLSMPADQVYSWFRVNH